MDRSSRSRAPLLAGAFILLTGLGVFGYGAHERLDAAMESLDALEQDRNLWKAKAEEAQALVDTAALSLNSCSAKVETLRSHLTLPRVPRS